MKRFYLTVLVWTGILVLAGLGYALFQESVQARALGQVQPISSPAASVETLPITRPVSTQPRVTTLPTATPFQPVAFTPTETLTPTLTLTPTASLTPSLTATPPPTPTPVPPASAFIEGISGRWPAYSLDCESRSAVDWAAYFGVTINELAFFQALPASDNPDLGFVGNVHGAWGQIPPNDYGVHAKPVAKLLRAYGLEADAIYGLSWPALQAEIAAGEPVIVWVVGRVARGTPVAYTSADGQAHTVVRFQHTVIVIGYDASQVMVLDGDWVYQRNVQDFLDSWRVLGNMAVIWDD